MAGNFRDNRLAVFISAKLNAPLPELCRLGSNCLGKPFNNAGMVQEPSPFQGILAVDIAVVIGVSPSGCCNDSL